MPTITAQELQSSDPKRFQKEYSKWTEYTLDYDWHEYLQDRLKEDLAPAGVTIERIEFRLSYGQGDYATFTGGIDVGSWMEVNKYGEQTYAERFPALYLAVKDYGDYAKVTTWRDASARVSHDGGVVGNTYSSGLFSALDSETWDELVAEQFDMAGLEQAMQDYVDTISHKLYRDLQAEYEHLTSEQSFIESCECNDVTFEIEECEA